MKKLAKIFAVVLVCALAVAALVACAPKPNTNYDEAKANLEKNGYAVSAVKFEEGDVEARISATNAKSGDSVMIVWYRDADAANDAYKEAKEDFEAGKKEYEEQMKEAKAQLDKLEGTAKEIAQKAYDAMKEAFDEMIKNAVVGKSGNVVYTGTKNGINATK